MPESIVTALAAVIDELPAIGRDGRASQQQGGYAYRGIEQITAAAAPLFAKHGVVFVPQVLAMEIRDLSVNNKPWTDTILTVRYRICGPGGPDDFLEATVVGIGRDNSDKGANKALTQAFKYALIQTLCIADAKDDADGATHEADGEPGAARITPEQAEALAVRLEAVGRSLGAYPTEWVAYGLPTLAVLRGDARMPAELLTIAQGILDAEEREIATDSGEPGSETPPAGVNGSGDDGNGDTHLPGVEAPVASSPGSVREPSAREIAARESLEAAKAK